MGRRGAKRQMEFDYGARAREKPALGTGAYARLWNIVDGGVKDALNKHPDYLTPKGQHSARASIVKRVTGTVIGFAEQSAKSRGNPAETEHYVAPRDVLAPLASRGAGDGADSAVPTIDPHCRIVRVRLKRPRTPDGRYATPEQRETAASRRTNVRLQLAVYRDLTSPELRKAETDAFFARASRPEYPKTGRAEE